MDDPGESLDFTYFPQFQTLIFMGQEHLIKPCMGIFYNWDSGVLSHTVTWYELILSRDTKNQYIEVFFQGITVETS